MTSQLWFVKNKPHEGPGLFLLFAEKKKIPFTVVDLFREEKFPEAGKRDAVVILGGSDSANDRTPKILNEIDFIRTLLKKGVACLGICLGLQLLVKAAGGTVYRNPVKETGFRNPEGDWFEIETTAAGHNDPLLAGTRDRFKVFHLHGETVELTPSMACLGRGQFCANQIVRIWDRAYGIQGHFELDRKMFDGWLAEDEDLKKMNIVKLRNDFTLVRKELEQSAEMIFNNFLKISGFLVSK